ncbi:class I adenylate cyclase [Shewanella sp. GXUN23E]|uniref:class I adenylate cyclase n=1 Tax=Shewanella sp. GXUN23E TaxID=3422498 RepID=UPI003D7F15A2
MDTGSLFDDGEMSDLHSASSYLQSDDFSHACRGTQRCKQELAARLNVVRLARAKALLSPLQRQLLKLIPTLFHVHQQGLPGYNGPFCPQGIAGLRMDDRIPDILSDLGLPQPELQAGLPALEGIYTMGSTGSFGQNRFSDLDIWLIHHEQLGNYELQQLRQKADLISQWLAQFQLEANFYLVHPHQFTTRLDDDAPDRAMGHEHSGTAQRWLLLEEFYRSHICLAGKMIAWWPDARPAEGLLLLGDVHQQLASEYLGAALWQLYKGLEAPHKALLKVLLLEAYAADGQALELLSDRLWQRTEAGDFSAGNDPYCILYEFIENYLTGLGDTRRLELIRRCFYLKCGVRLTARQQMVDWRYYKLKSLVQEWGWDEQLLRTLDAAEHWHAGQLRWFNKQLNELMIRSYQTLLKFAASRQLSSDMRIDELGMLTRKLHTYFSGDSDQLVRFNLLWSRGVGEPRLRIVRDKSWSLLRMDNDTDVDGELLYQGESLASLLCWACINSVATAQTRWFRERADNLQQDARLQQLVRQMLPLVSQCDVKVSKEDLCHPWYFRQVLFVLNLEQDPTAHWQGQEMMIDRLNASVLSLGRSRQNMLATIDILSINNWGEFHIHQYSGELALLQALTFVAPGLKRSREQVQLNVLSCSARLKAQLAQTVQNYLSQAARLSHHGKTATTLMQPLHVGKRRFGLFYNTTGLVWQDLCDARSLFQQLVKGHVVSLPRPDLPNEPLATLPEAIQHYATRGVTQYFLRQDGRDLDVFVLDEHNQQQHFLQKNSDISEMVKRISHQFVFSEHHTAGSRFNMPQFFRLERVDGELTLSPFGVDRHEFNREF